MKKCLSCNNVQETGNFCGKCGGNQFELIENNTDNSTNTVAQATPVPPVTPVAPAAQPVVNSANQESAATSFDNTSNGTNVAPQVQPQPQAQPNAQVEKVKEQSKVYFNHFKTFLKNPSKIFTNGLQEFNNSLITIILYSIILGITIYTLINKVTNSIFGDYGSFFDSEPVVSPPFFSIFFSAFIFVLITFAIVAISLFIILKVFGPAKSFKEVISYIGVHTIPSAILLVVGLLLVLINSLIAGYILIALSFSLMVSIMPLYIISRLLSFKPKTVDSYYGYLLYIVLFTVLFAIVILIIGDATIGNFIDELGSIY